VQVITAVLYCLFSTGIVFGFAAIKPVLLQEGVYRDQCTKEELRDDVEVCYNQELRYATVPRQDFVYGSCKGIPG